MKHIKYFEGSKYWSAMGAFYEDHVLKNIVDLCIPITDLGYKVSYQWWETNTTKSYIGITKQFIGREFINYEEMEDSINMIVNYLESENYECHIKKVTYPPSSLNIIDIKIFYTKIK